jgi:hypothetical protein
MARHFNYYDSWRNELLACQCGWRGTFEQGNVEYHNELIESECPNCSAIIALVVYPTAAEVERNEPHDSSFRRRVKEAEQRRAASQSLCLRSLQQLPEIGDLALGDLAFVLDWGFEEDGLGEKWTVIGRAREEIFRELAFWEGWRRYLEVADILKCKYGNRLLDLRPSDQSWLYLLGDSLVAGERIAQYRREHFPGAPGPVAGNSKGR